MRLNTINTFYESNKLCDFVFRVVLIALIRIILSYTNSRIAYISVFELNTHTLVFICKLYLMNSLEFFICIIYFVIQQNACTRALLIGHWKNKSDTRRVTILTMISHAFIIGIIKPRCFIVLETSLNPRFVANESENTRSDAFRVYPHSLINRMTRRT